MHSPSTCPPRWQPTIFCNPATIAPWTTSPCSASATHAHTCGMRASQSPSHLTLRPTASSAPQLRQMRPLNGPTAISDYPDLISDTTVRGLGVCGCVRNGAGMAWHFMRPCGLAVDSHHTSDVSPKLRLVLTPPLQPRWCLPTSTSCRAWWMKSAMRRSLRCVGGCVDVCVRVCREFVCDGEEQLGGTCLLPHGMGTVLCRCAT